jgi:uncharacterized protein
VLGIKLCPQRQKANHGGVPRVGAGRKINMPYRVSNSTRDTVLAEQSGKASTPVRRGVGLMGRRGLPEGGGLIIQPCNSVVSFFMRFRIDVLFLSKDFRVLHMIHAMPPWRTSKIVRGSKMVVELPAGTLASSKTELGDTIVIEPT